MPHSFAKGNTLRKEYISQKNVVSETRKENAHSIELNKIGNDARKIVESTSPSYYTINTRMTKRVQINENDEKTAICNMDCMSAFVEESSKIIEDLNVSFTIL